MKRILNTEKEIIKSGRGGHRDNSGRKPTPDDQKRKKRTKYLTDTENQKVDEFVEEMRVLIDES